MRITITLKRIRITISSKAVSSSEPGIAAARLLRELLHKEFPSLLFISEDNSIKKSRSCCNQERKGCKA